MWLRKKLFNEMCVSLSKSVAVYELLHSHARGQTDLTEDQLSNVVTGVSMEAKEVLARAGGGLARERAEEGWIVGALARVGL